MSASPLEKFHDSFRDPHALAREWKASTGGKVVGIIGTDVPYELVSAAGMLPVRLIGEPKASTDKIAPYVGEGVDPAARSIAERMLDGTYDYVDHVVVCSSPIIYASLYDFLLESRRVHGDIGLPQPTLFDFFRSQKLTASLYNRESIKRFCETLGEWSGKALTDDAIWSGIDTYNENRRLLADVNAMRCGDDARLSGTDALAINATSSLIPVETHTAMLRSVLDSAGSLPVVPGVPVIYTGSTTENTDAYRAIEAGGVRIVADDQELGSSALEAMAETDGDSPVDAICDRLQFGSPRALGDLVHDRAQYLIALAERTGAKAAVFHILAIDHPAALDYPRLRDRLNAAGIATTEYGARLYNETDFAPLTEQTREFAASLSAPATA